MVLGAPISVTYASERGRRSRKFDESGKDVIIAAVELYAIIHSTFKVAKDSMQSIPMHFGLVRTSGVLINQHIKHIQRGGVDTV